MDAERTRAVLTDRKKDTRHKIELGGLIIKAGMGEVDRLALYGGLVELAEKLEKSEERNRLERRGRRTFFS
ncbi:conjugal transfer protein TraD [uncultured Roseobacter sp.]|uniref:conjugal transfer protein TraD n=1 Tax=uncultured Roseobacter sp. TaxID=114847 RepID=UPI00261A02F6|nr:conjugal transfer protein TraD [uncultured Roseobacter sp.]